MVSLPDSDLLGLGFDILGEYSVKSVKGVVAALPPGAASQFTFGGTTYDVPSGVRAFQGSGQPSMTGKALVFESGREVQSHFAAKAGVKGTYGGFSGAFEALHGSDSSGGVSSWYGLLEGRLECFTMDLPNPSASPAFLADGDVQAMLAGPVFNPSKADVFFRVFKKFGTHIVTQVSVGASIDYAATVNRSAASDKQAVSAKLDLEYKAAIADAAATATADWSTLGKTWANSREVSLNVTGGDESLMMPALDPGFGDNYSQQYLAWVKTINSNPKMIDFQLTPLSELSGFSGQLAQALDEAIDAYTGYGIYVEARKSPRGHSSLIEVSGKSVDLSDPYAGGRNQPPDASIQLVVVDRCCCPRKIGQVRLSGLPG